MMNNLKLSSNLTRFNFFPSKKYNKEINALATANKNIQLKSEKIPHYETVHYLMKSLDKSV